MAGISSGVAVSQQFFILNTSLSDKSWPGDFDLDSSFGIV
jgi:hypothetical protein